uniref:Uncharacterized protein n=1 Tax=Arundo donax TaxID=35708 RepID=A0A0A9AZ44_ARUDO
MAFWLPSITTSGHHGTKAEHASNCIDICARPSSLTMLLRRNHG